jgi:hypothetical protein
MIASTSLLKCALNFFMNAMFISTFFKSIAVRLCLSERMKIEKVFTEYYNLQVKMPIQQEIIQKTLPKFLPFKGCHMKELLVNTACQ